MLNVLVTATAGYKGVKVMTKLLARGKQATIIDNFMYSYNCVLHLAQDPTWIQQR